MAGSTFLFLEVAPVSERFRVAEARSGWAAVLACSAEDFRARVDDFLAAVAGFHAPVADSREQADVLGADFPVLAQLPAYLAGVHSLELAADSREPGVELLVLAADFRARVAACGWAAAMADSAGVHSLELAADFRELAAQAGLPQLARSRALVVDYRAHRVSQVVQRSADSAVLPAVFLLRVAVAD